ncbi:hypothetical protein [Nostoc sp.]|uniref:hypothetical protein n=1 Tax=Nostoc sp. TaxID=1180 RepID=UPI002FFC427B
MKIKILFPSSNKEMVFIGLLLRREAGASKEHSQSETIRDNLKLRLICQQVIILKILLKSGVKNIIFSSAIASL